MAKGKINGETGKNAKSKTNPIEEVNAKEDSLFIKDHLPSLPSRWTHPTSQTEYTIQLLQARSLTETQLNACFSLIEHTSRADYASSSTGWHPVAKKKEMRTPELRYILVQHEGKVYGFTSLMPTWENGEAVVYCYEIHLRDELRGTGLGKLLMGYLGAVAESIAGVEKVMLTCFVSNESARRFYEGLGFGVDEWSPGERKLRGKRVVPDYMIMSRRVKRRDRDGDRE
ncbi:GNAT family acetyltransferase Nat4 [Pochonia chlamydosporia 170]|uniref:N-alpha-acetyltransferase 40 n=1 Tax=Pochonia chlamydosporia 170 TaxID=1380566 RepID=A0A179FP65_METCM|nr:GNAT family acetyltransferase Nat4 [Pochonia chlamydosporia 170]OAQ66931.1 GNAT family acetyltransferase Nat4 [Pochonia chlamydosporia 170]